MRAKTVTNETIPMFSCAVCADGDAVVANLAYTRQNVVSGIVLALSDRHIDGERKHFKGETEPEPLEPQPSCTRG